MERIKVNLIPNGIPQTCHASQYDVGRQIGLDLFDGFTPYVIQSGDTFTLNVRKPDNHVVVQTVTGTEGNTYLVIETTEQMTAVMGKNLCEIRVENGGNDIGSLNFIMQVEKDVIADGISSESVIEDLDALVVEAVGDNYYTKTEVDDLVGGLIDDESASNNKTWSSDKISADGAAVRGQINALDSEISRHETIFEKEFEHDVITSKNLFKGVLVSGNLDTSGNVESSVYLTTDFIEVEPNTNYVYSYNNSGVRANSNWTYSCQYDEEKNFISPRGTAANSITTGANTKYIRISVVSARSDKIMFEKGSSYSATYEPYFEPYNNYGMLKATQIPDNIDYRKINFHNCVIKNLYKLSDVIEGELPNVSGNGTTELTNSCMTNYIDLTGSNGTITALIYDKADYTPNNTYFRAIFYDKELKNIGYVQSANEGVLDNCFISIPVGAKYTRIGFRKSSTDYYPFISFYPEYPNKWIDMMTKDFSPFKLDEYLDGIENDALLPTGAWKGKKFVTYGDSITYAGSAFRVDYGRTIYEMLKFANYYSRGVGGQTYKWNDGTWQADADGSYINRGTPADNTKGAFCSWNRITTSIPENIRESIDLVIVMGGTNDWGSIEEIDVGDINSNIPTWSASNITDVDWVNDSTFYNGGDFDINTFTGAMASTLMKWQIWCPNAIICLCTPLCNWNTTTHAQTVINNLTITDICEIEKKVAKWFSFPVIDMNENLNINGLNWEDFTLDGVHPTNKCCVWMGRAIAGELCRILPMNKNVYPNASW